MNRVSSNLLVEKLRNRITSQGPITFREWMNAALYDPEAGYYCAPEGTPWGREGDYRTSPERSILFSATFASYFSNLYRELGQPSLWTIVEGGAGGGYFATNFLQQLKQQYLEIFTSTRYIIDEISLPCRESIRNRLQDLADKVSFSSLETMPAFEGVVFANELLDAFPVHRVMTVGGELREFYVGLDANNEFEWRTGAVSDRRIPDQAKRISAPAFEGQIFEVNLEIEEWLQRLSGKLKKGFVVLVDYGFEADELFSAARPQGSLRAFRRHEFVNNLLSEPGKNDITASVNWTAVKLTSESLGFRVVEFSRQDKFLLKAGLLDQLQLMIEQTNDEAVKARLSTDAREMILPGGMAEHFQVLVLSRGA